LKKPLTTKILSLTQHHKTKGTYELWKLTFINKKIMPLWHSFIAVHTIATPLLHISPLQLAPFKHSKLKSIEAQFFFESYYNIKPLMSQINIDINFFSWAFINATNGSHIWGTKWWWKPIVNHIYGIKQRG
jgi:hypothetical protein